MKKLLVLLVIAGVAGAIIARKEPTSAGQPGGSPQSGSPAAEIEGEPDDPVSEPARDREPAPPPIEETELPPRPAPDVVAEESMESTPARSPIPLSAMAPADTTAPAPDTERSENVSAVSDHLARARRLYEEGKLCEVRELLTGPYLKARGEKAKKYRELLEAASSRLVFNPRCTEGAKLHTVSSGETLVKIAKEYGLHWRMIARLNGISDPGNLSVGQTLKIVSGPPSIVAVKEEFRLTLLMDGLYVKEYEIGIGKDDRTPARSFVVDTMLVRPRWYKPGGGIIEYGEEGHLLGERWIGFKDEPGATGLGIHGTPNREGIGEKCSNGCIRMANEDVMELYDFAVPGTLVIIEE